MSGGNGRLIARIARFVPSAYTMCGAAPEQKQALLPLPSGEGRGEGLLGLVLAQGAIAGWAPPRSGGRSSVAVPTHSVFRLAVVAILLIAWSSSPRWARAEPLRPDSPTVRGASDFPAQPSPGSVAIPPAEPPLSPRPPSTPVVEPLAPEPASAPRGTAVLVDGRRLTGSLADIDDQWNVTLLVDGQTERFAAADLVRWGAPVDPAGGSVELLLADGGSLVGRLHATDLDQVALDTRSLGLVYVPWEHLRALLVRPSSHAAARDLFAAELTSHADDCDLLVLRNGDRFAGTLIGMQPRQVSFEAELGELELPLDQIAGIALNPTLLATPPSAQLRVVVGLADGSYLPITRVEAVTATSDAAQKNAAQASGATAEQRGGDAGDGPQRTADEQPAPTRRLKLTAGDDRSVVAPLEQIVLLQTFGGRAVYVSDLEVESFRHVPFLSLSWPYELDRNVLGSRLQSAGQVYFKGVGVHSASRLTFNAEGAYRRLAGSLALDDAAGTRGSVVFRVFADGQQRFASSVCRGGEQPVPFSVDIRGARQISLVVDFADRGDESDYANWLDVHLVR